MDFNKTGCTRQRISFAFLSITVSILFLCTTVKAQELSNLQGLPGLALSEEEKEEILEEESEEDTSATDVEFPTEEEAKRLKEIIVEERKPVTAASSKEVRERDFRLLIKNKPADLLRIIPGLITVQHTGGGKADQYFLRGFDNDHGTDIAFFIDKLPINLRSHAHGQGYTDLHFIIPETIDLVEVYKGNYYPQFGDFDNAGAVRFKTKDYVPESYVQGSAGLYAIDRFRPIARGLTLLSPIVNDDIKTLGALELWYDQGPFVNENDYKRINGFGKLTWDLSDESQLQLWGSAYYADWDASGLIPLRAVESGQLDRFGSIDSSEGGETQRYNAYLRFTYSSTDTDFFESDWYFTYYTLDLFSNFTFFLENPIEGDGIVQRDNRFYYGTDTRYNRFFNLFGRDGILTLGIQGRADYISPLVLANQTERRQTSTINNVDIYEISLSPWVELEYNLSDWARTVVGLRWDIYHFDVDDNLESRALQGEETDSIVSYKANLILSPLKNTEFYFNFGTGFHSNDARVVVGDPSARALPRSIGWEVGARTQLLNNRLDLAGAFWFIYLQSELIFVGDAGEFEPRGSTRRYGGELEARYAPLDWLYFFGDLNLVHARFTNGDRIPLAPTFTSRVGAAIQTKFGLQGIIDYVFIAERPADESGSVETDSYNRVDAAFSYRYKDWEFFVLIENLFDTNNRDSQFFFESRLRDEPEPVEDIHFTPGNPLNFRVGVTYYLAGLFDRFKL